MQLPNSDSVEVQYLSRLFDNTSECYKFFWFQAIITKVLEGEKDITYEELIDEMIAEAWYMVTEYHLNLGPRDTLEDLVLYIQQISGLKPSETKDTIIAYLRDCTDKEVKMKKRTLTKNVPYRLQAPFMFQMKGKAWNASESCLIDYINQEKRLIYYFNALNGMQTIISVQPEWVEYINKNQEIIKGWLQYNMILYLQKRNPSVPGIADKLFPPQERKLEKVKQYWRILLKRYPTREIYNDILLDGRNISIDHFVPWSYVAHDEFWDLNPTTKSINSSKSNSLPDWNKYFPKLAEIEYFSYQMMWQDEMVHKEFDKCAKDHLNNADIKYKLYREGQDIISFTNALEEVMLPVYMSARDCGFKSWVYTGGVDESNNSLL